MVTIINKDNTPTSRFDSLRCGDFFKCVGSGYIYMKTDTVEFKRSESNAVNVETSDFFWFTDAHKVFPLDVVITYTARRGEE